MITLTCSNGNTHNFTKEEFNDLRKLIASKYSEDFFEAYNKYMEKIDNFNVVTMTDAMHKVMEAVNDCLVLFDYDLSIVEFLTSNRTYTLESKDCTIIAEKIKGTEIGEREKVNLPTLYKFFKRAGDRNLTITWMPIHDHVVQLENELVEEGKRTNKDKV